MKKYKLQYDDGKQEFEALNDAEAQTKAREFLTKNHLCPQRRKNYLYRHTFYAKTVGWRSLCATTRIVKSFWRWDELPFCSDGRVRIGWC